MNDFAIGAGTGTAGVLGLAAAHHLSTVADENSPRSVQTWLWGETHEVYSDHPAAWPSWSSETVHDITPRAGIRELAQARLRSWRIANVAGPVAAVVGGALVAAGVFYTAKALSQS